MDTRAPDRKFALPSGVFFFLLLANLFHKAAHSGGCLVLLLPGGVGVGPQGKPCIEVAQHAGYGFHIYAVLQRRGCKCPCFPPRSISAPGLVLRRRTTKVQGRRKPPGSAGPAPISNPYWCNVLSVPFVPSSSRNFVIATLHSKSAVGTRKPLLPLPDCSLRLSTICSRRTRRTTLKSTERATDHLHTARFLWKKPSSFYSGKAT